MIFVLDIVLVVVIAFSLRKIALSMVEKSFVIAIIASLSIIVIHYMFVPYMLDYNIGLIIVTLLVILSLALYLIITKEDFATFRIKIEENISKGLMSGILFIVPFIIAVRVIPAFPFYIQLPIFVLLYGALFFYRKKVNNTELNVFILLVFCIIFALAINRYDFGEHDYSKSQNLPYLNNAVIGDSYRRVERNSVPNEGGFNTYFSDVYFDGEDIYLVSHENHVYRQQDGRTRTVYSGPIYDGIVFVEPALYDFGEYLYIVIDYNLVAYHYDTGVATEIEMNDNATYMVLYDDNGVLYYERDNIVFEVDEVSITLSNQEPLKTSRYTPYLYNQHVVYTRDGGFAVLEDGEYVELNYPFNEVTKYVSNNEMMFYEHNHVSYVLIDGKYMYLDSNSSLEYVYDGGMIVKTLIVGDFYIEHYVEVHNVISGNIFINNNIYAIVGIYTLLFIPIRRRNRI